MLELPFATIKRESLSVVVIVTMMMVMAIVAMIIVVVSFSGTIQTDHAKQSERCVLQNFHLFLSPQIISLHK
jgi:flagellar basal body-associated protein FliL